MVKMTDITQFFKPKLAGPCQNAVQGDNRRTSVRPASSRKSVPYNYLMQCHKDSWNCTTITIGNKQYGRLSFNEQVKELKKEVRAHMKRYSKQRYYYCFEENSSGVAHAHGIEIGTYQQNFINSFKHIGNHNTNDKSFCPLKSSKEKYWAYVNKDVAKLKIQPLHNINKQDIL